MIGIGETVLFCTYTMRNNHELHIGVINEIFPDNYLICIPYTYEVIMIKVPHNKVWRLSDFEQAKIYVDELNELPF